MRITFFGLTLSSSWGNGHATPYRALLRALHDLGHKVTFYEKDVAYYARHRDLTAPSYCDLVFYSSYDELRQKPRAPSDIVVIGSYCPDGARISDDLLQHRQGLIVYYDLDTPVTLNRWVGGESVEYVSPQQLPAFDLVLSFTGGRILDELRDRYGVKSARPLYGCVDPDFYMQVPSDDRFACDLSYMGTFAADRQEKLERFFLQPAAQKADKCFLLAGSMYPTSMPLTTNVKRLEHVAPDQHPALYSSSAWTLNITRGEMAAWGYCPSGRFFEAAACGCPILSDSWEGLESFFAVEGSHRELILATSAGDIVDALTLAVRERREIARRARQRTLDEHTGAVRAREFLRACEQASSSSFVETVAS